MGNFWDMFEIFLVCIEDIDYEVIDDGCFWVFGLVFNDGGVE